MILANSRDKEFLCRLMPPNRISLPDLREQSATGRTLKETFPCCRMSSRTYLSSWLQLVLRLGMLTYVPLVAVMLSLPPLASAGTYNRSLKPEVCVAAPMSTFDFVEKDAVDASWETSPHSLNLDEEENEDYKDDDDISEGGGKGGLLTLLSGLMGKGGMGGLSEGAMDMLSGLAGALGEGKEAAALKEAMQGLSGLMGRVAAGGNGFSNSDIEGLFKAAADPLINGDNSDFLDKLQNLISKHSPEVKSLLDDLVSDPYMDVEEISMPTVTADVYAVKFSERNNHLTDSLEDRVNQPVLRPKPIVLQRIKSFAEAPEDLLTTGNESNVCHVLVLSGTGVKGAFQAGAVVGLAEQYKAREKHLRWDVVSGVSFGGVAAALSLPFEPGQNDELDYGRSLWSFWRNLRFEDILKCKEGMRDLVDIPATLKWVNDSYKMWKDKHMLSTLGAAHSCDPSPYQHTLRQQLTRHLNPRDREKRSCTNQRTAALTAAIMGGGEKKFTFTSADVNGNCEASQEKRDGASRMDLVLEAMLATSALPGIFPLVKFTSGEEMRKEREDEAEGEDVHEQEREKHEESQDEEGKEGDKNAKVQENKGQRKGDVGGRTASRDQMTKKYLLADGSLTSFLNITPAIKACQEKLIKTQHVPKADVVSVMKEKGGRKTHDNPIRDDELSGKDLSEGRGIVFDFIVASEVDASTVDENLEELFDSDDDVFDNGASPLININTLAESFPQAQIRHVISFEDPAEVAHDVMDLRSVGALLEHGRVAGWKAATLKSVRALKD